MSICTVISSASNDGYPTLEALALLARNLLKKKPCCASSVIRGDVVLKPAVLISNAKIQRLWQSGKNVTMSLQNRWIVEREGLFQVDCKLIDLDVSTSGNADAPRRGLYVGLNIGLQCVSKTAHIWLVITSLDIDRFGQCLAEMLSKKIYANKQCFIFQFHLTKTLLHE